MNMASREFSSTYRQLVTWLNSWLVDSEAAMLTNVLSRGLSLLRDLDAALHDAAVIADRDRVRAILAAGAKVNAVQAEQLKGSVGEGPNHSNYSDRSSVRIISKFRNFR